MHFLHHPFAVFRTIEADIDKNWNGEQRREAVHESELPEADAAGDAGHDVDGRAQAGQETGDEDEAVTVSQKEGLGLQHPLRREQFGEPARFAQVRAEFPADDVHHPIAAKHTEVGDYQHGVHVFFTEGRDDAGGHEGDVFRQGQSHAAENEDAEHGVIAVFEKKALQERH